LDRMDATLLGVVIAQAALVVAGLLRVSFLFGKITAALDSLTERITRVERRLNHMGGE